MTDQSFDPAFKAKVLTKMYARREATKFADAPTSVSMRENPKSAAREPIDMTGISKYSVKRRARYSKLIKGQL